VSVFLPMGINFGAFLVGVFYSLALVGGSKFEKTNRLARQLEALNYRPVKKPKPHKSFFCLCPSC